MPLQGQLDKTFSWEGIGCNEALSQIDIHGVGRDLYWPPQVHSQNKSVYQCSHALWQRYAHAQC